MTAIDTSSLDKLGLSSRPEAEPNDRLGQKEFLKLMTAQLENQDPTKPMESDKFLSQIAQFGVVQGIQDLQKNFDSFAASMTSNQALQAASLVGRDALVPSTANRLTAESGMQGAVDLPSSATDVSINIYDSGGQLVRRVSLGAQSAGTLRYQWDGMTDNGTVARPGLYAVDVQAQADGKNIQVENLSRTRIESVDIGKTGEELKVNLDGIGTTKFSQLREIW